MHSKGMQIYFGESQQTDRQTPGEWGQDAVFLLQQQSYKHCLKKPADKQTSFYSKGQKVSIQEQGHPDALLPGENKPFSQ